MKIATLQTSRRFLRLAGIGLLWLAFCTCLSPANADPISELRSLSIFRDIDLAKLAGGDVAAGRGPGSGFNRGLSVESAYVLRLPVPRAIAAHQQWNPARHAELRVYIQSDIAPRPSAADFQKLASAPANGSVRAFAEATSGLPQDASKLQLSKAEASSYSAGPSTDSHGGLPPAVSAFWNRILQQRASSFVSGGIGAQPAYETSGGTIRASDELARLLRDQSKVRTQFGPAVAAAGLSGGRASVSPSLYWQLLDVEGQAAVNLGAFYQISSAAGAQAADVGYYASGGFYASLTLYQMWPVTVDGQAATLVWRVDLVSAAALGELRGVERLGSGAAMMREVQKSVRIFVKDAGGR